MKKLFAIFAVAMFVVGCGNGAKTIEDQVLAHIVKIEKAVSAGDCDSAVAAVAAYDEWQQSLNAEQLEELGVAVLKHEAQIMRILGAYEEMQVAINGPEVVMVYSNSYDGYLNVRATPSSKSTIVCTLRNGPDGAELIGVDGNWSKVRVNGVEGYVYSAYVQSIPTEPVYISASAVVGEWGCYHSHHTAVYTIKSNGKFEYTCYQGGDTTGSWYLSGNKLFLKPVGGKTIACTVNGRTLNIGGTAYERQ